MPKMKLIPLSCLLAGAFAVTSCGDSGDTPSPYEGGEQAAESNSGEAPAAQSEAIELGDHAGRWSTESGAVGEGSRLVIDLTSEGDVSIDVRTMENGAEAIRESAMGKASAQGSVIKGTVPDGEGVHAVLEKYSTWTLDPAGTITGVAGSEPVKIAKEGQ